MRSRRAQRDSAWLEVGAGGPAGVRGREAAVRADADGGITVEVAGASPVSLRVRADGPCSARVAPLRWERAIGDAMLERCDVLPDRATAVLRWTRRDGERIRVDATFAPQVSVVTLDDRRVVLCDEAGNGLCIAASHPLTWRIQHTGERLGVEIESPSPLALAFGACDDTGHLAPGIESMMRDPALAERMAGATLARLRATTLDPAVADARVARAFMFACSVLRSGRIEGDAATAHWMARGLLSAGDLDGAAEWLQALEAAESVESSAHAVLAHAAFLAASGRSPEPGETGDRIARALACVAAAEIGSGDQTGRAALIAAAWRDGARLAGSLPGLADAAATLSSRARRFPGAPPLSAAAGPATTPAGRLATLAWQGFQADRPRQATAALGEAAAALLAEAAAGDLDTLAAAAFCTATATGLLGIEPDAPKDRVTIRPRVGNRLLPARVERIRSGDALLDLDIRDDGDRITFAIDQSAGAVPVQLVFEPWISAPAWSAVRIDDRPAALDTVPLDGGWAFPVQLVPDRSRRLEVVLDENAGPP